MSKIVNVLSINQVNVLALKCNPNPKKSNDTGNHKKSRTVDV